MEAVKLFEEEPESIMVDHLKETMEKVVKGLFGEVERKWVDASFPFTEPSYEMEIKFKGEWLEVLGCGIIHKGVLN